MNYPLNPKDLQELASKMRRMASGEKGLVLSDDPTLQEGLLDAVNALNQTDTYVIPRRLNNFISNFIEEHPKITEDEALSFGEKIQQEFNQCIDGYGHLSEDEQHIDLLLNDYVDPSIWRSCDFSMLRKHGLNVHLVFGKLDYQ